MLEVTHSRHCETSSTAINHKYPFMFQSVAAVFEAMFPVCLEQTDEGLTR